MEEYQLQPLLAVGEAGEQRPSQSRCEAPRQDSCVLAELSSVSRYRLRCLWREACIYRSEERRVGKGVDLGGRRIIKKKKKNQPPPPPPPPPQSTTQSHTPQTHTHTI